MYNLNVAKFAPNKVIGSINNLYMLLVTIDKTVDEGWDKRGLLSRV